MIRNIRPVFTLPGIAVFLISFVVLIRSLAGKNVYEILLSCGALTLWVILGFAGGWAGRRLSEVEPLWKPLFQLTASSNDEWQVTIPAVKLPRFFRLHFVVKGRFFPQGSTKGCLFFAETSLPRSRNEETAAFKLSFPLGGLFAGEGSCRLRDVFGFFSFPCGQKRQQTLQVRCAPCTAKPMRVSAQSGAEDRRNKNSTDEERYYMREYAPGDRFRDINWKSSERIDTLITRISPDNQEKVTRIEVYFRNYGSQAPSIGELWLLDRAKARLAWFLRTVKEEKDSYIFHVRTAAGDRELKDMDEIDAFLGELASLPFSPVQNEEPVYSQAAGRELYVFSTSCDAALPAFLLTMRGTPLSLFMAQPPNGMAECESLRLRDFIAGGSFPSFRWLFPKKIRHTSPGGQAVIDYAEARL
ncbi:MAG: DUF58 domain-containing protein [Treponema sp.]|jgi:hypothetical protein|nr:DUF58 domain-containing protein [Treponema sp.]